MSASQQRIDALEAQGFSRLDAERAVQRVMATMSLLAQAAQYQESMFTPANERYHAAQNTLIGISELEDAARKDLQRVLDMV